MTQNDTTVRMTRLKKNLDDSLLEGLATRIVTR